MALVFFTLGSCYTSSDLKCSVWPSLCGRIRTWKCHQVTLNLLFDDTKQLQLQEALVVRYFFKLPSFFSDPLMIFMELWASEPASTISTVVSVQGRKEQSLLLLIPSSSLHTYEKVSLFGYIQLFVHRDPRSLSKLSLSEVILDSVRFTGVLSSHQHTAGLQLH